MPSNMPNESWVRDVREALFADNSFLSMGINDDQYVVGGKTVHLPIAGDNPDAEINRTIFPATATRRTDPVVSYDLDSITTNPTHITYTEEMEVSYDMRNGVLTGHKKTLMDKLARQVLYSWGATQAANIIRTSGAARTTSLAGATGNRKRLTYEDVLATMVAMNNQDVPSDNRYLLLTGDMAGDLLADATVKAIGMYQDKSILLSGYLGTICGFNILQRSTVNRYSNASTPALQLPTTAGAATFNQGAIAWHQDAVRRALGTTEVYLNERDALYYGTVLSTEVRAGGRKATSDEIGVFAIVEAAA